MLTIIVFFGCASLKDFSFENFEEKITSVSKWGGTPGTDSLAKRHTITHITLHHQGEHFPEGKDPAQYLKNLQSWSRREKKWIDMPYHFIIDLKGKVYEGRKIEYSGDTNTEYDPSGHALINVVGNFEDVEPNEYQLEAVVNTMAWLAAKYNVPIERIKGHKDYSKMTVCPGKNLYKYLENGYFANNVKAKLDFFSKEPKTF
ncbi:MAG: peptidoglycan recognition family protein [Bacteroidota bacterium]